MSEKSGSVIGGMLLIAGSCIGAGMLALPILTGLAGFFPSLAMFLCAWVFMTLTALLLVEVNGWFKDQVHFITMVDHTLGRIGRGLSWILYLFLFYALLVAYIAGSGGLFFTFFHLPAWSGALFFVLLFGWVVYMGTRTVDLWNRVLMVGKIAAFLGLVFLGVKYMNPTMLLRTDLSYAFFSLPILIISFGFHNMIPSLTAYMKGDLKRVRLAIWGGSIFTLCVYLIWEIIALGILPMDGEMGLVRSLKQDREASQAIAGILGSSWVSTSAQALAFFAILTSFLSQALSLVHFLADGLKVSSRKSDREHVGLCALALLPPLALALYNPQLFFKALNFAGGICAVILFGILPVCMIWLGRYRKQVSSNYQVPGGRPLLCAIFCFALFILFFQLSTMCGAPYIPKP